jgi:hypothetical protein
MTPIPQALKSGWIEEVLKDDRYHPGMGFILDRRKVSSVASSDDARDALDYIKVHLHLFAGSRWGVLQGNIASLGMARMGQILSSNLPIEVDIFEDLDAAKDWICNKVL